MGNEYSCNSDTSDSDRSHRCAECDDFCDDSDDETHLGVYVCVLSNVQFEGTVNFKSYLHDSRGKKNKLIDPKKQAFPREAGFRFLESMCKESIMGDARSQDRYVQDDDLDLCFKITGYYKTVKSDVALDKLLQNNKVKDITLVVKGEEFPANRAILMARSPTFATLLNAKKDTTKLQIKDVDPDIMKQLLLFIHTGYVSKLFTHAKELSAAVDKYELTDLKDLCKKIC